MRVLFAGGGTGGHLFPGLAVAEAFAEAVPDFTGAFVGTERGLEARVIPNTPYQLHTIPVFGLVGKGLTHRLLALSVLPAAFAGAARVLSDFRPDLVVGVGGYASAPVLLMAGLRRIPRVILEQNAVPGVTNRVFGPSVERVFLSFPESESAFKGGRFSCPGNPVRAGLLKAATKAKHGSAPHLLAFGGSQGARALNDALMQAVPLLLRRMPELTVTHQTGLADHPRVAAAYAPLGGQAEAVPFIDDMGTAYARADLVLCRSGATTVAELTALGKPSLMVPFPAAAHDHQTANARTMEQAGAAVMMPQGELTPEGLTETLHSLLKNRDRLDTMGAAAKERGRPDAARDIVSECLKLIRPPA